MNINVKQSINIDSTRGFSLVELMIASTLALLIILALSGYMVGSAGSTRSVLNVSETQNNARFAMGLITESLKRSGYLGSYVAYSENGDLPDGAYRDYSNAANRRCNMGDSSWPARLAFTIFGENNSWSNNACAATKSWVEGVSDRSDTVTVRYAAAETVATASFDSNQWYLRSALANAKIFRGGDQAANTIDDIPQSQHELVAESYFIADSARVCASQPIPSLYLVHQSDSNRPNVVEAVQGIERLELQYEVDGVFKNANAIQINSADPNIGNEWSRVTSVRVWLLARSLCPVGDYLGDREINSYVMGDRTHALKDNYEYVLLTATVALRNSVLLN